jgi:hypothetical protein
MGLSRYKQFCLLVVVLLIQDLSIQMGVSRYRQFCLLIVVLLIQDLSIKF